MPRRRHILSNLLQAAMVTGTFAMASAIISEASLSFLGLGVPPEIPTWGSMLADGREHISTSWWLSFFPGLCIFTTVLGINLLGDALRNILDPRLKRAGARIGRPGRPVTLAAAARSARRPAPAAERRRRPC